MRQSRTTRRSWRAVAVAVAATAVLVGAGQAVIATSAYAGSWAEVTCTQANLQPAPVEGWAPNTGGTTNGCDPYLGGLVAALSDSAPAFAGVGSSWVYTAPSGSTIAGGTIVFQLYAPQGNAYVTTGNLSNAIASCKIGTPCGGQVGGATGALNMRIAPAGGTHIYAVAECSGAGRGDCAAGAGGAGLDAQVNVYQAIVDLNNNATPAATNFAGGLVASGPISGTQPITFTASDPGGPGVSTVTVAIDGKSVYYATPDTNSGHCVPVGTDAAGNSEYLYQAPCKQTVAVSVPVSTSALADGAHDLSVTVTDAAGNSSVVLHQPVTTANRTTVSADLDSSHPLPPAVPSTSSAGAGAPAPVYAISLDEGTQALLRGVGRSYANSALPLSGTLRNSSGVPAPGVPITLLAQNGADGTSQALTSTTSDASGHWALSAPRGPSRRLTIAYGTQAQAAAPRASVTITETVTPGLSLRVHVLGRGRLRFSGQLSVAPLGTPRPVIVIEAGKGRHWQSVGEPVTVSPSGRYKLTYASGTGSIGYRFTFRAVAPATNLFTAATSPSRTRAVR